MDIISHGLWGAAAIGRESRKKFIIAFLIGAAPDFFSFGILFFYRAGIYLGIFPKYVEAANSIHMPVPIFVYNLYNITHSLVVFLAVFGLVWLILQKPFWPLLVWALHILMDIPLHSYAFFPTPFLWPVSNFKINGISWANPGIFFTNVALLLVIYAIIFYKKRLQKS